MAIFSRLQMLQDDELALLLATPTPTRDILQKRQVIRQKQRRPSINVEATLTPVIPQKRQKIVEENDELFEFRANPLRTILSSSANSIRSNRSTPAAGFTPTSDASLNILDIKAIVQNAISPLIDEIRELKKEIRQSKTGAKNTPEPVQNASPGQKQAQEQTQKTVSTTTKTTALKVKKPTWANIASGEPRQTSEKVTKPWTLIQKRKAIPATELAPRKATEPSQRRIILQRQKNADKKTNLPNLLLALNKAMKEWGLPDHIRLIKLGYSETGALSGILTDKATATMLIPHYSDALIKVAIQHDTNIIGISQAEEWYKLRIHRVYLARYFDNPEGLQLAKEEIEATQGLDMPLMPQWLANKEAIRERYHKREINFSTIVITVRNKLEADTLIAKGLHFGGYNHTVDRYWETGPAEICPKCLEYGHTSFGGCSKTPKCYICAGNHEANEHKCPITGCSTPVGKACVHLPVKCINCKGPHFATSNNCPKKRAAIEEAKRKKQDDKRLKESRRRMQVVILKKPEATTTPRSAREQEMELDSPSQTDAQLQAQLQSSQC